MLNNNFEVEVLINGHPVKEYFHQGKNYIEARKGQRYSLRFKNNSSRRVMVVVSVDGLSVIDGQKASYESPGYIVGPRSSVTIDGWRKSTSEVAQFYFSDQADSYAEIKTVGENLGVIGVAVFYEKEFDYTFTSAKIFYNYPENIWYYHSSHTTANDNVIDSSTNNYNCCTNSNGDFNSFIGSVSNTCLSSQSVSQDVGTGWGEYKNSEVITACFDKEKLPASVFRIYYNTKENLEKIGIDFNKRPEYVCPSAFPGNFCQPPQGK